MEEQACDARPSWSLFCMQSTPLKTLFPPLLNIVPFYFNSCFNLFVFVAGSRVTQDGLKLAM